MILIRNYTNSKVKLKETISNWITEIETLWLLISGPTAAIESLIALETTFLKLFLLYKQKKKKKQKKIK